MKTNVILLFLCVFFTQISINAQTDVVEIKRLSITERYAAVGGVSVLDTYLSPQVYKGTSLKYLYRLEKQKPNKDFSSQIMLSIDGYKASNESKGNNNLGGSVAFAFTRFYVKPLNNSIALKIGCEIKSNLGFTYNVANGNNPAQLNASINIAPTFAADYKFSLFKKDWNLKYQISLPIVGFSFAPNYGQSYYEMFSKGNYDKNISVTHLFNAPSWYQTLTLNYKINDYAIGIGYLNDVRQQKINNLKQHFRASYIIIGVTKKLTIYGKKNE